MSELMRAILPEIADLASVEMFGDPPDLSPHPDEVQLIATSVETRRNEFVTARHCARLAMQHLGVEQSPILKGEKGEPRWPGGVVGSLTHCKGYRAAVVGRAGAVRSVGIDAEPHAVLPDGVLPAISLPLERHEMATLRPELHWDRILFCAKEATYKAWFPLTQRWLGFEDAHITFDVDTTGTSGRFVSRILIDPAARSGPPLTKFTGRWSVSEGLALTAIVL